MAKWKLHDQDEKPDAEFERIMAMVKDLTQPNIEQENKNRRMLEGVYAMLVICIPVLTISTVLWQWL